MIDRDNLLLDTSGRFKTDKHFKNTILKNCSRLRQRSTDDHYANRNNTIHPKISNIKRITNYKKINSLNDNYLNSRDINNNSKDNISVDFNSNAPESRSRKIFRSNIRKAFFNDMNVENKDHDEKRRNFEQKDKNDSFIEVNRYKSKDKNNKEKNENNEDKNNNIDNNNIIKNETNDGIKELIIDIKENNNMTKNNYKRSNSIRRIMNSLYYHSYTADKREKNNKVSDTNILKKKEKEKIKSNPLQTHNKNHNSVFNNNLFNGNKNTEKTSLNTNSNSSYIYTKKNKRMGIHNNYNLLFNTYSTEDNSFRINDNNNKENGKRNNNNDSQNQELIKVKIVYQKPHKRSILAKEKNFPSNTVSINQTMNRFTRRRQLFMERKAQEDIEPVKENSKEKKINQNYLTPIIRYNNQDKKLIGSPKDDINKRSDANDYDDLINNDNYIIAFFDDIIELCNGIEEKTIFEILTKNINKKYIIDYDIFILERKLNEINNNFDYCFKYFSIIIICFYFLSKDETLYKYNSVKVHLLFIQYIYSCLCYIGYQDLNSKNIKRFFKDYHFKKKVSIIQCTTSIIKLLFDEKEEYISMNKILKQLMINARTTKVEDITKIINQTILFCFNTNVKSQIPLPFPKQKNSTINSIYHNYVSNNKEENNKNDEKMPVVPYIKTSMRKKFCLVLDLDETISHSLKLSFGYYFLLRPGVIEFLTELSELYEIIIFTSSPKIYADSIIDKIDEKGILISHRLYKPHVIFERGKSVKKLNLIGRDLNKIIFVDNMKSNAKYNPKNLYLIPSWTDDIYDDELFKLKNKLKYIYSSGKFNDDITKAL